jgi:creatinine amidohydrolase
VILQHATWRGVEDYLRRSTGIVIPIGSTEQHGPTGAIGTDAICAEAIAHRLAAEDDILVGPTIALGAAQFNLAFPGTVSLRAATLMAVIRDYVGSLAAQGFTRFYFVNGHGGNIAPCNAAFQDLYGEASLSRDGARMPAIRCRLRSWWEYEAADALRRQLYGAAEGIHATPSEIAIALAAVPGTRHAAEMTPPERIEPSLLRDMGGDRHYDAQHHRRRFPDGRIGSDPSLATAEDGARLLALAVAGARADYARFLAEP